MLDGVLALDFQEGYAPRQGDRFTFLDGAGAVTGAFDSVAISGLAPGFQYELTNSGGELTLRALNNGIPTSGQPWRVFLPLIARQAGRRQLPRRRRGAAGRQQLCARLRRSDRQRPGYVPLRRGRLHRRGRRVAPGPGGRRGRAVVAGQSVVDAARRGAVIAPAISVEAATICDAHMKRF